MYIFRLGMENTLFLVTARWFSPVGLTRYGLGCDLVARLKEAGMAKVSSEDIRVCGFCGSWSMLMANNEGVCYQGPPRQGREMEGPYGPKHRRMILVDAGLWTKVPWI